MSHAGDSRGKTKVGILEQIADAVGAEQGSLVGVVVS